MSRTPSVFHRMQYVFEPAVEDILFIEMQICQNEECAQTSREALLQESQEEQERVLITTRRCSCKLT